MRATAETWGLILAGGEGLRLRSLTRFITGAVLPVHGAVGRAAVAGSS
jgi:ADP-glucose pyrophosphorylase